MKSSFLFSLSTIATGVWFAAASIAAVGAPAKPLPTVLLTATFPSDVTFNVGPVKNDIALKLANNTKGDVDLTVGNKCLVHIYEVVDAKGNDVESTFCTAEFDPQKLTLREAEVKQETDPVVLHSENYQDKAEYTLIYSFWGVTVQKKFIAHVVK